MKKPIIIIFALLFAFKISPALCDATKPKSIKALGVIGWDYHIVGTINKLLEVYDKPVELSFDNSLNWSKCKNVSLENYNDCRYPKIIITKPVTINSIEQLILNAEPRLKNYDDSYLDKDYSVYVSDKLIQEFKEKSRIISTFKKEGNIKFWNQKIRLEVKNINISGILFDLHIKMSAYPGLFQNRKILKGKYYYYPLLIDSAVLSSTSKIYKDIANTLFNSIAAKYEHFYTQGDYIDAKLYLSLTDPYQNGIHADIDGENAINTNGSFRITYWGGLTQYYKNIYDEFLKQQEIQKNFKNKNMKKYL